MTKSLKRRTIISNNRKRSQHIKLKKKITAFRKNAKYNCALHEIAHFVIAKYYRPRSQKIIKIELNKQQVWVGKLAEPEDTGKHSPALHEGKISIAGAIIETLFLSCSGDRAYSILKENQYLEDDYLQFQRALVSDSVNFRQGETETEKEGDRLHYFIYLYSRVIETFKKEGYKSIHKQATNLVKQERIIYSPLL